MSRKGLYEYFQEHFSFARERKAKKNTAGFDSIVSRMVPYKKLSRDQKSALDHAFYGEFTRPDLATARFGSGLDSPDFTFFVGKIPVSWISDVATPEIQIESLFYVPVCEQDIQHEIFYIAELEETIKKNGFDETMPVLLAVGKDGYFKLIGGNHRLQAVRNLVKSGDLAKDHDVPVAVYRFTRNGKTCIV